MRKTRLAAALVVAMATGLIAPAIHTTQAAHTHDGTFQTFGVLAYGFYCADGQPGCGTYATATCQACPEAYQVLAYGFGEPGKTAGKLSKVFAECDHYVTDSQGKRHDYYEYAGWMTPASGVGLISHGDEESTRSQGTMAFSTGLYGLSGDSATVNGNQIADNGADTNVSGGFTVHLSGILYDGGYPAGNHTLSCSTAKIAPGTAIGTENEYEPFDPNHPYFYAD